MTVIPQWSSISQSLQALRPAFRRPAFVHVFCAALIFAAAAGVYSPALKHGFIGDDFSLILNNDFVADPGSFSFLLNSDFLRQPYPVKLGARPLTLLSLMLDHAAWGFDPFGYHLTNILLHGLNSALLFLLVLSLGRKRRPGPDGPAEVPEREPDETGSGRLYLAVLSGLVFALHPLQAEAVNIASFRADLLCAFFCFSSLLAFSRAAYLPALLCFTLGLFSKETAVMLPLAALLYAWLFPPEKGGWLSAGSLARLRNVRVLYYTVLSAELGLVFLLYFWAERFQYPLQRAIFPVLPWSISPLSSFSAYVNTISLSALHYFKLLLFPVGLSLEYQLPLSGTVVNAGMFLALGLAGLCYAAFRSAAGRELKFGLGFLLIMYLPVSNLVPLVNTVNDRYMYLPLAGFGVALSALILAGLRRLSALRGDFPAALAPGLCAALLCLYGCGTVAEGGRFRDMLAVYSAAAAVSPQNPNARYNLALACMEHGDYSGAVREFEAVIVASPLYRRVEIWHSLGVCWEKLGNAGKAKAFYAKVLLVSPGKETFTNLADMMQKEGRPDSAAWLLRKSLELGPDPVSSNNLGTYYARRKEFSEAIRYYREAVRQRPDYTEAWLNLLNACKDSGDPGMLRKETLRMASLFAGNHWEMNAYAR